MYRVVVCGTGNVGRHALRSIVDHPDLELAGVRAYTAAKRGTDAGDLIGTGRTGVTCVVDLDDVLKTEADCVCYTALGSTVPGGFDRTLDELCTLLRAGFNVTSSALEHLVHPAILPDALRRLSDACAAGQSSFYDTGINPGFTMDLWPITMSRLSRTIDQLRVTEVVDMCRYDSGMARDFMGFGLPAGDRPIDAMHRDSPRSPFYASLRQVADAMGLTLSDVRYERAVAITDKPVDVAIGTLEPGTVAALKMMFIGVVDGRDFLVNSWVWRMSDDVAPEWPTGDQWILEIDGDPQVRSSFALSTTFDARRPVSLTVATLNVNAIPALCRAAPGVQTNLTLPVLAGGYPSWSTVA
ncbi:dihydrodipicolinate reductase [Frankia sp. CNm7]|uniref:Dihydrodipicolinate reductase n=1 Tax=Frankia nepalensis TaxID=1836974 RepID=A0A937RE89_9ACTN|nr:dihydrodipicolinate reductase [Frankia nepalensis]MBL7496631.1 dihydrodipicolinate reductase [Frankia nepalensis]MBL7511889.1 dihydrodipicolinate reductase [Frankia nepalensis]MBL7516640.1 dihydrodipicolinate reductase [Frankia nepalensis]MBL7627370.1 dihydrodipicolinate reductase [Frankia nepalensis]